MYIYMYIYMCVYAKEKQSNPFAVWKIWTPKTRLIEEVKMLPRIMSESGSIVGLWVLLKLHD